MQILANFRPPTDFRCQTETKIITCPFLSGNNILNCVIICFLLEMVLVTYKIALPKSVRTVYARQSVALDDAYTS